MSEDTAIGQITFTASASETGWTTIVRGHREPIGGAPGCVQLFLDGIPIRSQRAERSVTKDSNACEFEFYVSDRLVARLPEEARIEVKDLETGLALPFAEGVSQVIHGKAEDGGEKLREMLAGEYHIDHWGELHRPFGKAPELRQKLVDLYAFWRDFFLREENIKIFMIGGNLLGIVREGDFLDHDDDLDVGIGLQANSPKEAADAFFAHYDSIAPKIRAAGYKTRLVAPGHYHIDRNGLFIDVFATWLTSDGYYYRTIGTGGYYGATEHRLQEIGFRGTNVYLPEFPERELELSYGPNWKIPDPHFVWNISPDVNEVIQAFKRAGWAKYKEHSR